MSEVVIFDTETTGLGSTHRIVEIAGIIWDYESDSVVGEFETLVNPERNIPADSTKFHGLTSRSVSSAPTFAEIGPWLANIFHRRTVVCHNANFDLAKVNKEFSLAGIDFALVQASCTMMITGKSLADASADIDYEIEGAHTAIGDARATLAVLRSLDYRRLINGAGRTEHFAPNIEIPQHTTLSRFQAGLEPNFQLERYSRKLEFEGLAAEKYYLAFLDEVLEDMVVTPEELNELSSLAATLGLSQDDCDELNMVYLSNLETAVLRDGIVTKEELEIIEKFAGLLRVTTSLVETATESQLALKEGALISATGNAIIDGQVLSKEDLAVTVEERGFKFVYDFAKKDGLALLLADDASSQSGKTTKARKWGIPVMSIDEFLALDGT
jgi:DNA polymerase-3 subunit epsilon